MHTNPVVLMITPQPSNFDAFCRIAKAGGFLYELRRADDLPTALARIAGGGVQLVVLDISGKPDEAARLECLQCFRASAPHAAVILWANAEEPGLPRLASHSGVKGWLTSASGPQDVSQLLPQAFNPRVTILVPRGADPRAEGSATVIAVLGVKGGVGTTTVAMNVAASLTSRGSVILAEIRPMFGSLNTYFHPGRMVRGFPNHRDMDGAGITELARSLWPVAVLPGLRVLFGPQSPRDCVEISAPTAASLLRSLSAEADFVVVDLPVSLSAANSAILAASHHLALVLEPVQNCLTLGNLILEGIRGWERFPASIAAVVVKRTSEGVPLLPSTVEAELGLPIGCIVPPAPALCLQGEQARLPMICCDPDSLAANSFANLANRFALQATRPERPVRVQATS